MINVGGGEGAVYEWGRGLRDDSGLGAAQSEKQAM